MKMNKIQSIWTGWKNYVGFDTLPDEVKKMAAERVTECLQCPFLKKNKGIMIIEKTFHLKTRDGYQCGKCGCSIYAKVTIEGAKCPIGRW